MQPLPQPLLQQPQRQQQQPQVPPHLLPPVQRPQWPQWPPLLPLSTQPQRLPSRQQQAPLQLLRRRALVALCCHLDLPLGRFLLRHSVPRFWQRSMVGVEAAEIRQRLQAICHILQVVVFCC